MNVRVSVVVPTYNTGPVLQRLVDSLDNQTLPTDQFEAIFVDDGSTDGTAERLEQLCAARPNYRTTRIPNSGWPGRPRNVGMDLAVGDYVIFVDHDDHLAADALERVHAYATENGSDVVVPREIRVGRQPLANALFRENRPKVDLSWPLLVSLMTPHKLFRREFLTEHGIRFPEGKRRLEDHVFVLTAYFRAQTISVYADTPVYFWVMKAAAGVTHSSKGIDPVTYYPFLEEVLDLVEANTAPGPDRDRLLAHWYRGKVLGFIGRAIRSWDEERQAALLRITSELASTRFADVDPYLGPLRRLQSAQLRAGHIEELIELGETLVGLTSTPVVQEASWHDGRLRLVVTTRLRDATGEPVRFRAVGDRVFWAPAVPLGDGVDESLLDLTDQVRAPTAALLLRDPVTGVHHEVSGQVAADLAPAGGSLSLATTTTFEIDPTTAAFGDPLHAARWNIRLSVQAGGLDAVEDLPAPETLPPPALLGDHTVVAVRRQSGGLALAVDTPERPVVGTARPRPQDVEVRHTARGSLLRLTLPGVHVEGSATHPASLSIGGLPVAATLVTDGQAAYVDSWLSALPGRHALKLAVGGGKPVTLNLELAVAGDGQVTAQRPGKKKALRAAALPPTYPALRSAVRKVPGLEPALRPVVRRLRDRLR